MVDPGDELFVERHYRSYAGGMTLYDAGTPAEEIYLIKEGRVRLIKRAPGVERTVGLFGAGELVGEEALLPGAHRTATAEALESVTAVVVDRDTFLTLTRRRPEVGEAALQQLLRRLQRAEEQIDNAMVSDPTVRVLNTLVQAAEGADGAPLALSPLELSVRTGLGLDQVRGVVGQLRDRGYLELGDQTITVVDPAALRQLQELLRLKEQVRYGLSCR